MEPCLLNSATDSQFPWYGLRVRSNFERTAAQHLESRGFENFCPSYKAERIWSDRKKVVDQVLFPGYVFCRMDLQTRIHVLTVPGVVGVVGFGQLFPPIPEVEIERVKTLLNSGLATMPWPFLREGQRILIERGPLEGVEGTLVKVKGNYRLVVSITLLQRSVSAEIDRRWIRPVASAAQRRPQHQSSIAGLPRI